MSQIKTEEELQREKEREEMAKKAAKERELAQEQAQKRQEEVKRLRQEREKKETILEKEEVQKEEVRTEGFKSALSETQAKEEEERKKFLERVEAKVESKEEMPSPPPPVEPKATPAPATAALKKIAKKVPKPVLRKPSFAQKFWIRIVLTFLVLAVLAAIATFWYWYLEVREEEPVSAPLATEEQELIIPAALISTEDSRTLELSLLGQLLEEDLPDNQFTRLIIKNIEENKVLGLKEFFEAFEVKTPETFYNKVENDFTLFIYSSQNENRLGLIAEVKEPGLLPLLKGWEQTMEQDFEALSVFLGKTGPSSTPSFKEAVYQNTTFRYLSLSPENFGICWLATDEYFILTFSGGSIVKTIDKINE